MNYSPLSVCFTLSMDGSETSDVIFYFYFFQSLRKSMKSLSASSSSLLHSIQFNSKNFICPRGAIEGT